MNSRPTPTKKNDEDKGRVELINELNKLRGTCARQSDVIAGYERIYSYKESPDRLINDLEDQRELVARLKHELRYKDEDLESQREELAARLEELRLSLEQQSMIEKAVIKSERDFRAVVTKNADAMIVLDADGRVRYANPAAESLFCMPAAKMAGKLFGFPIVPNEPIEMYILREFKAFVAVEMRLVEVTWDDKPSYLISLRDMTDRIKAQQAMSLVKNELEESLLRSEANLARAQLIAHIGNWSWDILEDRLEWSDECYRILGYRPGKAYPLKYDFYLKSVLPEDRDYVNDMVQASFKKKKPFSIDYRISRADDGTVRHVRSDVELSFDEGGRLVQMFGVFRDLTEWKQAVDALRESEARYRDLVENANSIIVRSDRHGNITYINLFAQRFFGYSEGEIVGKNAMGTIIPLSDSAGTDLKAMLDDLLQHPEEFRMNVHENMRKNGELVWVSWTNKAIYDNKGEMAGLLSIGNDITPLKEAERALAESKMQSELYLDLMGHDINNMHQIALGYLELAREMIQADEGQAEFLDKPIEVLQRSSRLISNVRKMQKLVEGAYQIRRMDVCEVLLDVQKEYAATSRKPVILDLNGIERCYIRANDLLFDVFSNLVVNAIKHTGEWANIKVDLEIVEETGKNYCRVSVEDDGPGIPDDFKNVIFNRMLKGTAKAKGMGLGLYLVKSLVDSYGGRVWAEDRIKGDHSRGARFVVLLPTIE